MNGTTFNDFIQTHIVDRSRRRLVAGLGAGFLSALSLPLLGRLRADEVDAKGKKKKRKKKRRKKRTPAPVSPPDPQLLYECAATPEAFLVADGNERLAQTFFSGTGGVLRRIEIKAVKKEGSAGDYVVQLLRVETQPQHLPSDVLATVTILDTSVPVGEAILVAEFDGPALAPSTDYAVAVGRPGTTDLSVHASESDLGKNCAPGAAYAAPGTSAFEVMPEFDMLMAVFVA